MDSIDYNGHKLGNTICYPSSKSRQLVIYALGGEHTDRPDIHTYIHAPTHTHARTYTHARARAHTHTHPDFKD